MVSMLLPWLAAGMGLQPSPEALPPPEFRLPTVFTGMLLFVGFDLGIHRIGHTRDTGVGTNAMLVVLGITVVLLSLWGTVSLAHVPLSSNRALAWSIT